MSHNNCTIITNRDKIRLKNINLFSIIKTKSWFRRKRYIKVYSCTQCIHANNQPFLVSKFHELVLGSCYFTTLNSKFKLCYFAE